VPGLTRAQIMATIPHAGAMCLLDCVLDWDRVGIHCRSEQYHCADTHPLRHNNRLAAVNLVEYGAQAAAVHAGLMAFEAKQQPRVEGLLVSLRDVTLPSEPVDTLAAPLDIYARRQMGGPQGMIYHFEVINCHGPLSSGRLTIAGTA
jgi:predicted hotdog family 3-hydroxylacyl-ACP dehydratase